ncbi:MAG: 5'-3' exonuclease H3TH domain-containing protein, partial [Candidatus Omnitrophica bacterium]|nr:5'-3' exonuclease H3TH domain-containing protein [Candidatus Omnitrophota bacterium]
MNEKSDKIFLIDGHAICYRAYYAIKDLRTSKGVPTNAVYGFLTFFRKLVKEHSPDMVAVVFDAGGPTERHGKFKDYKANRKPMPDEMALQLPLIKELLEAMKIPVMEKRGFEADDIIATAALRARAEGIDVCIVTSDKDALQLVDAGIKVLSPSPFGEKLYDEKEVLKKYGIPPVSMTEYMALAGDASDNIPGVKGIGQVTAGKLISEYRDIDSLYGSLDHVSSAVRKKLEEGKEDAFLSRELAVLNKDVPLDMDIKAFKLGEPDRDKLSGLLRELEFTKLLMEMTPVREVSGAYKKVSTRDAAREMVEDIRKKGVVSVRFKTTADGIIAAFSVEKGKGYHLSFSGEFMAIIREVLSDPLIRKVGYNVKSDL